MLFRAFLCALLLVTACTHTRKPVTVFAASSLKDVIADIADTWDDGSGPGAGLRFDSSSTLARQIESAVEAHVFISAAPEWMDKVKPIEQYNWLSNRLVCVVAKESPDIDIKKLESLAIGNEQVPAGKYARAALKRLGIPIPARTIYGSNVRDVLSKVTQGGATAGIVYATDAASEPGVRIIFLFPEDSHPKIVYSVGLLKPEGRAFYMHLQNESAMQKALKRGFIKFSE
ncbi:MAG: molybdate ABC transporter substrate-binding protein [Spirochaetia bacterium]|nr:molybdate ABC transporter substrate-binding protein [Spirochaetia bacterium]